MHLDSAPSSHSGLQSGWTPAPMRVFAVDDHPMYTCGLAAVLTEEPGCQWLGATHTAADALSVISNLRPDVVLLDQGLGGAEGDGLATLAALRNLLPHARYVLILADDDLAGLRRAVACDADGIVLRSTTSAELLEVVRAAWRGERRLSGAVQQLLSTSAQRHLPGDDLTPRERDLLGLMAHGLGNREIARRLGIALPTVKFHVTNIMSKLGADNRTAAVIAALRYRIVTMA